MNMFAALALYWTVQVVGSEDPAAVLLLPSHREARCAACLGPLPASCPLPCPACSAALFCTPACWRDSPHAWECGVPVTRPALL